MTTTRHRPLPTAADDPAALLAFVEAQAAPTLAAMDWAEDEITTASRRHPEHADLLFHAFKLLVPRDIGPGMRSELLYRRHVLELLQRLLAGEDPRPATSAEICLMLAQISAELPMHGSHAGLYFRMWLAVRGDQPDAADQAANQGHYEHLYGPQIDKLEAEFRRRIADPHRQLGDIACDGRHDGSLVTCRFAASPDTTS